MEKCEGKTGHGKRPNIHKMANVGGRKQRKEQKTRGTPKKPVLETCLTPGKESKPLPKKTRNSAVKNVTRVSKYT